MTLQFGASLTDDTRSVNYDRNMFIIQATGVFVVKANNKVTDNIKDTSSIHYEIYYGQKKVS